MIKIENSNIIGIGHGKKITNGKQTKKNAIMVFVKKKLPKSQICEGDLIPEKVDGVPTDVIEVGDVVAFKSTKKSVDRKSRTNPCRPGMSIGHYNVTAGTFGAFVNGRGKVIEKKWKEVSGHGFLKALVSIFAKGCKIFEETNEMKEKDCKLILSNNHVLADEYSEGEPMPIGDSILQPGAYDGGTEVVATLSDAVPLKTRGNFVDGALAVPLNENMFSDDIIDIGQVKGTSDVSIGEVLKKSGRTTEYTEGKVISTGTTINITYDKGTLQFEDQIVTEHMSEGGDSGSLVLNNKNKAVGLLFAGSEKITLINPISHVCRELNINFI